MIPDPSRLPWDEIHLHFLRRDDGPTPLSPFLSLLSPEERGQYRRFEREERRREFLTSRLMIRRLAAGYLNQGLGHVPFGYSERGKPFVKGSPLRFSLSHSGPWVACSFGWREVGIDVEGTDPPGRPDWAPLAKRYFSLPEYQYLCSQPPHRRPMDFLRIFTRKEAYVKALGVGLGLPFESFTVPLPPQGRSQPGSFEYFTPLGDAGGHCVSHVAENNQNIPLRYQTHFWDEALLADALRKAASPAVSENQSFPRWARRHLAGLNHGNHEYKN